MKLLQFIREITDSDEEFLAVIQEMNRWVNRPTVEGNNEEYKQRFIHVPYISRGFNFSKDEHRRSLDLALAGIKKSTNNTK